MGLAPGRAGPGDTFDQGDTAMTARRSSPTVTPSPWHALREYLIEAYSNAEMRVLVEVSLLAEAGSRLPDERVSPQEYAHTLCTLIQRHSGVPTPEFWRQLVNDRPQRQRRIAAIKAAFAGAASDAAVSAARDLRHDAAWWRFAPPRLVAALLLLTAVVSAYCVSVPKPSRSTIQCRDGTYSATCTESRPGCCSHHGGPRERPAG